MSDEFGDVSDFPHEKGPTRALNVLKDRGKGIGINTLLQVLWTQDDLDYRAEMVEDGTLEAEEVELAEELRDFYAVTTADARDQDSPEKVPEGFPYCICFGYREDDTSVTIFLKSEDLANYIDWRN